MNSDKTLYYVLDPMCSWCWGFAKTWKRLKHTLPNEIHIQHVMGGLASDNEEPMSDDMRSYIQKNWQKIETTIPSVKFNYDFWKKCAPRRSTYPACRAVIAIRRQKPTLEAKMIELIQKAYYLQAKNPSNDSTLIKLASGLDINLEKFAKNLNDNKTQQIFHGDITLAKKLGATGFPSLFFQNQAHIHCLQIDYNNPQAILKQIIT